MDEKERERGRPSVTLGGAVVVEVDMVCELIVVMNFASVEEIRILDFWILTYP